MSTTPLPDDVRNAMDAGRKLDAIRLLREHTGMGLAAAKAAVEANGLPSASQDAAKDYSDLAQQPPAVHSALAAGHKIEAIRLLRQASGVGLKEAKAIVDAARLGPAQPGQPAPPRLAPGQVGNSPLNVGLWVALAAVLGLVAWRMFGPL